MARPFTDAMRAKYMMLISDLYLTQRIPQVEIAQKLKISQSTVSIYLDQLADNWVSSALFDFDAAKKKELQNINKTELEAWRAWKQSKKLKTIKTHEEGIREKGRVNIDTTRKFKDVGDPRYLDIVMRCIDKRCKILGLDAPQEMKHSGIVGAPQSYAELVQMLAEQEKK